MIHYKPEKGACSVIDPKAIYLCDSGAQFLDGTTDTTRTLHFGEPTEMERKAYTLVLKGNIALEKIKFPKGVSGFALDTLARQYLWAYGLDYRHGTGHGVGSYLVEITLNVFQDYRSSLLERTRGANRYWYSSSILRSAPCSGQRHLKRTRLLRRWLVRYPH